MSEAERPAQARRIHHLTISAAEHDRNLIDAPWAGVDECVHWIGLATRGDGEAVRWVAVRHAHNHDHVVATLALRGHTRLPSCRCHLAVNGRGPVSVSATIEAISTGQTVFRKVVRGGLEPPTPRFSGVCSTS